MNKQRKASSFLSQYSKVLLLLGSIIAGSLIGLVWGKESEILKPIGDIFLNLLFTAVIPLVFFAIASAIANVDRSQKLGRVIVTMLFVFLSTILISAFLTILATWLFPITQTSIQVAELAESGKQESTGEQITRLLTAPDFFQLFSRQNMLAFIIFSVITGFAALRAGKEGESFRGFLNSGNEVMKQFLVLIMKVAPIGLGAYFAYQVGVFGPQLFGTYAKSLALYYGFGLFYFIVLFSIYALIAGGVKGLRLYWRNNILPSATALGTCSSIATIPANLDAAKRMAVPEHIANIVVPLGASLHKDGSSISSIIKIAVAFALVNRHLNSADAVIIALGISVVISVVEGGIPNGGYTGELLLMSAYGLPIEVLPAVMVIGTLVDPLATLLNATGDTVAAMLVTRFEKGRNWLNPGNYEISDT